MKMQHMKLSNLKTRFREIRKDDLLFFPLVGGLICTIVGVVFIPLMKSSVPNMVPLFYSLPRAAERLASRDLLYILPLSTLIILFVNFYGIFLFATRDKVISRMLAFSALLASILSLYTLFRIVFLIT